MKSTRAFSNFGLMFSTLLAILFFGSGDTAAEEGESVFDLAIYGGTSAAVVAAVQASRMDKTVIIVSPYRILGGLSSGGLGFTDTGNKAVIGGLSREFYHRVYNHYQQDSVWRWQKREDDGNRGQGTPAIDGENRMMWIFEPHVAGGITACVRKIRSHSERQNRRRYPDQSGRSLSDRLRSDRAPPA